MSSADLIEDGTSLPELAEWVGEIAELTKPDDVVWCDGSQAEWERLTSLLVANGTFYAAQPRAAAEQLLVRVRPWRRGPGRGPDVHLLQAGRRRGSDQQLDRAG
jgi:GTP-dependent phosphoenolpyruvate carboxykinase